MQAKAMKIHRNLQDKKEEILLSDLYDAIALIKTPKEAKQFFEDLCSPGELESMADRWRVVALVKAGMPYRKIHEETKVSVTTIGRVARAIMRGEGGYDLIYERMKREKSLCK
jgi:TrpR-related protein YerC/YecD